MRNTPAPSHRSAKPPTSNSRQPHPLPLLLHKPRARPSSRADLVIRTDYDNYTHDPHPCADADLIFHMSPICTQQQQSSAAGPDEPLQTPLLYSFPRPSHAKPPPQKRTAAANNNDASRNPHPRPHPPISRPQPPPVGDAARTPPRPRRLEGFSPSDAPPRSRTAAFQLTPPRTPPLSVSPVSVTRTKHSSSSSAAAAAPQQQQQHVRFRDASPPYRLPPGLSAVPSAGTPSWAAAASGLRNPFYGSEDDSEEADEYYAYYSSGTDSGSSSSSSYMSTSSGGFLPAKTDPFRFSKFLADLPR